MRKKTRWECILQGEINPHNLHLVSKVHLTRKEPQEILSSLPRRTYVPTYVQALTTDVYFGLSLGDRK